MTLKRIIVFSMAAVFVVHFGCKENAVGPTPLKDPRTLVFTVDTLAYPDAFQTIMQDIGGTAANNVFAVGLNSTSSAGTMYRFDGKSWKTTGFHISEGGPITGAIDFSSLLAFSSTNIWFVGDRIRVNPDPPPNFIDSSFILHYNGSTWQEYKAYGARGLRSIHGIAPNDIWACGFHGTLLYYEGVSWKRDSIPMAVPQGGEYILRDVVALPNQKVYAIGHISKPASLSTFYFFQRSENTWTVVDSAVDGSERWGITDLWASPSGNLYSVGRGVFRWDGSSWTRMFDYPSSFLRIWGYTDESFFVVGGRGAAFHYNGKDFFQYAGLINDSILNFGVWGDGQELFVVGIDGRKSYVYHGR